MGGVDFFWGGKNVFGSKNGGAAWALWKLQKLIEKWKSTFELDNKLSKKGDFEIQFIKDYKNYIANTPNMEYVTSR